MTKPIARDPIYRRRIFDAEIIERAFARTSPTGWSVATSWRWWRSAESRWPTVRSSDALPGTCRSMKDAVPRWPAESRSTMRPSLLPESCWRIGFVSGGSHVAPADRAVSGR